MNKPATCLHCGKVIEFIRPSPSLPGRWVHLNGEDRCKFGGSTLATPGFPEGT